MNIEFIKGVVVPMITPIDGDELIDEEKIREQVDYVINGGGTRVPFFGGDGEIFLN